MECQVCFDSTPQYNCKYCKFKVCIDCMDKYVSLGNKSCMNCRLEYTFYDFYSSTGKSREFYLKFKQLHKDGMTNSIILPKITKITKIITNENKLNIQIKIRENKQQELNDFINFNKKLLLELSSELIPHMEMFKSYENAKNDNYKENIRFLNEDLFTKADEFYNKQEEINENLVEIKKESIDNELFIKELKKTKVETTSLEYCCDIIRVDDSCIKCQKEYCKDCQELLFHKHKCNPDTLKTLLLLKTDSKICPVCSVKIHRIEGCADFFCTICKSCFNWNTLKVMTNAGDNVHYKDYIKSKIGLNNELKTLVKNSGGKNLTIVLKCLNKLDNYNNYNTPQNDKQEVTNYVNGSCTSIDLINYMYKNELLYIFNKIIKEKFMEYTFAQIDLFYKYSFEIKTSKSLILNAIHSNTLVLKKETILFCELYNQDEIEWCKILNKILKNTTYFNR
jgi:hypothetical protein